MAWHLPRPQVAWHLPGPQVAGHLLLKLKEGPQVAWHLLGPQVAGHLLLKLKEGRPPPSVVQGRNSHRSLAGLRTWPQVALGGSP